ncbi:unnamed protein product [Moneuplotes crassus]|uniref:Uncharacterized protein n=1 Tax=Euplotes crassus TaxID=5936 RepID=A0AAD1U7F9_EUPCR|nr:unnamed protein product [Moneuplotes crassus]
METACDFDKKVVIFEERADMKSDGLSDVSESTKCDSDKCLPVKKNRKKIKGMKTHKCYKCSSDHDNKDFTTFSSIKEVPSPKEDSPFLQRMQKDMYKKCSTKFILPRPVYIFPRGAKENSINQFLDFMGVHQVFPTEVDYIKDIKKRNNSSAQLKLGGNPLLKRRMQNMRLNSFQTTNLKF